MNQRRHLQVIVILLALLVIKTLMWNRALAHHATPMAQGPVGAFNVYLPAITRGGEKASAPTSKPTSTPATPAPTQTPTPTTPAPTPTPTQTPAGDALPADLVATWFTGAIPPSDFYDPTTGQWRDTNGLGQMYVLNPAGSYTYAGFLRLQNGQCLTEVSVYKEGNAQAANGVLALQPRLAKTRTVVICGSRSETTTDGPFELVTIDYVVGADPGGLVKLTLTEDGETTEYYKKGMVESLVGVWQRGEVTSGGFYDLATDTFAPQTGAGAWYRFNADGTYSFGEFGYSTNEQGCLLTGWIYQTGTLSISGGQLTTTPITGTARMENECSPDQPQHQAYVEAAKSYTWFFRDQATEPKLVLIPLDYFQEFIYTRE